MVGSGDNRGEMEAPISAGRVEKESLLIRNKTIYNRTMGDQQSEPKNVETNESQRYLISWVTSVLSRA